MPFSGGFAPTPLAPPKAAICEDMRADAGDLIYCCFLGKLARVVRQVDYLGDFEQVGALFLAFLTLCSTTMFDCNLPAEAGNPTVQPQLHTPTASITGAIHRNLMLLQATTTTTPLPQGLFCCQATSTLAP